MKKFLTFILLIFLPLRMFAVLAKPGSGVYGDEYFHYRIDSNGVRLPSRMPQQIQRPRFQPAIQTSFPSTGDIRSIVILVEYQDVSFTIDDPKGAFTRMLNTEGYRENGGTGSARDYFISCSSNLFRPQFDVYGPYKLPQKRAYYKSNPAKMVVDACEAADDVGVDFTQYDFNNDGNIDNIFIYYAGHNPAEGGPEDAVWPHRSQAAIWDDATQQYYKYSVDDVWIMDYACTSELSGDRGSKMCGIGTFCHEFSHVLGLDDLYNTINSDIYTVGAWDIMCYGNYNNDGRTPPAYSAYERWMMGWIKPVQLSRTGDFLLEPIELTGQAYLISKTEHNFDVMSPHPNEFWLLENRQAVCWDAPKGCLPGTGMLISHITFNKGKWNNNTPNNTLPLGYDICEAYYKDPYDSSPSDTYPGLYNISAFTPVQNNGDTLHGQELTNIQAIAATAGENIVFHYGEDNGSGMRITYDRLPLLSSAILDGKVSPASSIITAEGKHLEDKVMYITVNNPLFEISLDGIHWTSDTLWDAVNADGTYRHNIYVRYYPTESCAKDNTVLRVSTGNGVQMSQSIVSGESYRPILISEVESLPASALSPYGFTARWTEQKDAQTYNITLYKEEESDYKITAKEFVTFTTDKEQYLSEQTDLPITKITFSVNNSFALISSDISADIDVEACTGNRWKKVGEAAVRKYNSGKSWTIDLPEDSIYTQIRLTNNQTGTGSYTVKDIKLHLTGKPVYVCKDAEVTDNHNGFAGLLPNTDYYYYLTCSEEKGCEKHTSRKGNIMKVHTYAGETETDKYFTIGKKDGDYVAWLNTPAEENDMLVLFDASGRHIADIMLTKGCTEAVIPTASLPMGQIYTVKLVTSGKLERKGLQAKFIL